MDCWAWLCGHDGRVAKSENGVKAPRGAISILHVDVPPKAGECFGGNSLQKGKTSVRRSTTVHDVYPTARGTVFAPKPVPPVPNVVDGPAWLIVSTDRRQRPVTLSKAEPRTLGA